MTAWCMDCGGGVPVTDRGRPRKRCVECARLRAIAVTKSWQERNPDRVRALRQKWQKDNPEKAAAKSRRKYQRVKADPVRYRAYLDKVTAWKKAHADRVTPKRRAEGTLLECTACRAMLPRGVFEDMGGGRLRGRCPECDRGRRVAHRASRGAAGDRLPVDLVARLKARQTDALGQLHCALCTRVIGPGAVFHVDHRVPVALGGRHEEANLQIAHRECNLRKGARMGPGDATPRQPGVRYEGQDVGQGQARDGEAADGRERPGGDLPAVASGSPVECGVQVAEASGGTSDVE